MSEAYFEIIEKCRMGLLPYLARAISLIPVMEHPSIMDAGCGYGVPTLALAEQFPGAITAIDPDIQSIHRLEEKVIERKMTDRFTIINCSLFDLESDEKMFDLILAEGLLNVVGFEKGFLKIIRLLKKKGYFIIHDEYRNHRQKIKFFEDHNCKLLDSFRLDEKVWWNNYYKCLEKEINTLSDTDSLKLFKTDLREIGLFRKDPSKFNSVYYVIEKQ
jgi:ubiquinone/menaquinone biosynthesis C-methylase UbiE